MHPTLRKLPAFGTYATAQQQLVVGVRKDDADVCAKPFGVNPIVAHSNRTETLTVVYFTLSVAARPRRFHCSQAATAVLFLAACCCSSRRRSSLRWPPAAPTSALAETLGALRGEAQSTGSVADSRTATAAGPDGLCGWRLAGGRRRADAGTAAKPARRALHTGQLWRRCGCRTAGNDARHRERRCRSVGFWRGDGGNTAGVFDRAWHRQLDAGTIAADRRRARRRIQRRHDACCSR